MAIYHGIIALALADVLDAGFEVMFTTVLLTFVNKHGYGCIEKLYNPISSTYYMCIRDIAVC